ncbi:hypothetical protein FPV67DRAFT_1452768 [Lyophyllum atratum]|nr:hypothetical protein FPV67DRAFT_1453831 [Lyophyllum atratum]KAF8060673.1 hypothetical protein FPV67DRAFT_1452768 [Lyophyllum atratum]
MAYPPQLILSSSGKPSFLSADFMHMRYYDDLIEMFQVRDRLAPAQKSPNHPDLELPTLDLYPPVRLIIPRDPALKREYAALRSADHGLDLQVPFPIATVDSGTGVRNTRSSPNSLSMSIEQNLQSSKPTCNVNGTPQEIHSQPVSGGASNAGASTTAAYCVPFSTASV